MAAHRVMMGVPATGRCVEKPDQVHFSGTDLLPVVKREMGLHVNAQNSGDTLYSEVSYNGKCFVISRS